mmetsp:Transcript_20634/g.57332  ORF Transcript_20634/g.57332 Transcript_20634/m.57332 type:complete len:234 (-) Transcript_20634:92-793(-)
MTDAEPSFQHTTRSTTSRHPPCEVLKIQVRDETGSVLWFQLKTTQKLKRLFDSYKARMLSAAQQDVQFVYKGLYLEATHTPQQLHMKDGDVMECVRVQVQPVLQEAITVVVRDQVSPLHCIASHFIASVFFCGHDADVSTHNNVIVSSPPALSVPIDTYSTTQNNIKIWFKIRTTQRLRLLFQHYAKLVRYPAHAFQFSFQGQSLTQHHTSAEIGLKEGDIIECFSPFPASAA